MKKIKPQLFFVFLFIMVLSLSLAMADKQKQKNVSASKQTVKSPTLMIAKLPDLTITYMKVTLVSTEAGKPGIEFPTDKVKIEATLKNIGEGNVTPSGVINIILKKNNRQVDNQSVTNVLSGPGSTWTYTFIDTFAHLESVIYEYKILVSANFPEASTTNNEKSYVIKEETLHPKGTPDFTINDVYCEKKVINANTVNFNCQVMVRNIGNGFSSGASFVDIIKEDDNKILGKERVDVLELPGPGATKKFTVTLNGNEIPKGAYNAKAKIEPVANETNSSNNLSSNSTQINNTTIFFAAVPQSVKTGSNVTLKWEVQAQSPNQVVTGVEIHYQGYLSGKYTGLPGAGELVVCPYGDTIYNLRHPTIPHLQAQIKVQAPCPSYEINDEMLALLNQTLIDEISKNFKGKVRVNSLTIKIKETGIAIDLKGVYIKKRFPDIDIKIHALAWVSTPEGPIQVTLKEFKVDIGSTATRVAWDILTLGIYEGIKKELDDYFGRKYKADVQHQLAVQINTLITWNHMQRCFLKLHPGVLEVIKCTRCMR